MVRALRIPADQDDPITALEVHDLADYQAVVGGWIEPVDISALGVTVFVNEEGLLRHLPINPRATFLWWYFVPEARQKAMLVGPALVVGLPDAKGDSTDVPDTVVDLLTRQREYAVLVKVGDDPAWHTDSRGALASIVLPLTAGEPEWFLSAGRYEDYFTALVWAMVLLERWEGATDTNIVPVDELPAHLRASLRPTPDNT